MRKFFQQDSYVALSADCFSDLAEAWLVSIGALKETTVATISLCGGVAGHLFEGWIAIDERGVGETRVADGDAVTDRVEDSAGAVKLLHHRPMTLCEGAARSDSMMELGANGFDLNRAVKDPCVSEIFFSGSIVFGLDLRSVPDQDLQRGMFVFEEVGWGVRLPARLFGVFDRFVSDDEE